ncbi:MAG TPA: SpoIID/LytB domain-containing protein, partial [Bacteroidales bacterium]|nr:SpoIID/LytB domain-containing protein [Bacteroidales bacterium]
MSFPKISLYLFIWLNLLFLNCPVKAQVLVRIGIKNDLRNLKIKISEGDYALTNGHDTIFLKKNDSITLDNNSNKLNVRYGVDNIQGDSILLINKKENSSFSTQINGKWIEYEDNAIFYPKNANNITFINQIDIDKYVASVILSETYPNLPYEFYKAKAIVVRTYTIYMINIEKKHINDKYDLCNTTHCQLYRGKCNNQTIINACNETKNMIIVDNDNLPILAVYHSNSGGLTNSSENYWGKSLPYLITKNDEYSTKSKNSTWTYTMPKEQWLSYLAKFGIDSTNKNFENVTNFYQPLRKKFFIDTLTLRKIREDFNLKSTYFNITTEGDKVIFNGRGYGHGVGLSQEGAIEMAKEGKTFTE